MEVNIGSLGAAYPAPGASEAYVDAQARTFAYQVTGSATQVDFDFGDTSITGTTHTASAVVINGSGVAGGIPADTTIPNPGVVRVTGTVGAGYIIVVSVARGVAPTVTES